MDTVRSFGIVTLDYSPPSQANLLHIGVHLEALVPELFHSVVQVDTDAAQCMILVRVDLCLEHHIGLVQCLDQGHGILNVHIVCVGHTVDKGEGVTTSASQSVLTICSAVDE